MNQEINDIINMETGAASEAIQPFGVVDDYSEILKKYELDFKRKDFYLEVGDPAWTQGWIIDIAVIPIQLQYLLETIIPLLIREKLAFKIVRSAGKARAILGGEFGYLLLGKLVSIYPANTRQAVAIARELIGLTNSFKGPQILTDRKLGSVIFTRYGAGRPIMRINEQGVEESCIYNSKGALINDPYSIPFRLPENITWPFVDLTTSQAPKIETVLQDKYKPIAILKEDAKGTVKKGLYLEKWWRIKWCVIKEGRQNMIGDSKGRDMTDRLRWQYKLHRDLENIVPLPRVYDLFEENGNTYLIMQYIKGLPLDKTVMAVFNDQNWRELPVGGRLQLLDYACQVLDIVDRMHKKGYVHRDITPANFLVDKKRQLWMIDLELSYNVPLRTPYPPFRLGTPGYMSPEQIDTRTPKVDQDIYTIGGLFLLILTGIPPEKYALEDQITLREQLTFFIPDPDIGKILCSCLSIEPSDRPTITHLKKAITDFRERQTDISYTEKGRKLLPVEKKQLKNIITNTLRGLTSPALMSPDQLWFSMANREDEFVYSQDSSKTIYPGFSHGLSGVLYLLARAHQLGFPIDDCHKGYEKSLSYIGLNYQSKFKEMPGGFYTGTTGIAMGWVEGIRAGLLPDDKETLEKIEMCFKNDKIQGPGIVKGIAGQGLALLKAASVFETRVPRSLLSQKINQLIAQQQKDGSWMVETDRNKNLVKPTGFGHGIAGIICFLLEYIKMYNDNSLVNKSVLRAIEWLTKRASKKHSHVRWHLHASSPSSSSSFQDGCAGVVLSLVKANEVIGSPLYRQLAEDCLRNYPLHPVSVDCTLATGLTGLGEVYLEAATQFRSEEWKDRADWIAQFLSHHYCQQKDGACYWMPDGSPFTTAGLAEGNSGIIHFLLRNYHPNRLSHPLLAI